MIRTGGIMGKIKQKLRIILLIGPYSMPVCVLLGVGLGHWETEPPEAP